MHGNSSLSLSRRNVVRLSAGGVAAALVASGVGQAAAQDATPGANAGPATFVLVPGQWTGAFIWHLVAPLLREAGHDVYATTCTGLGDRIHLASAALDLDHFVTDVVNVLEYEDLHDVTLVGHSFGGMIITGVAERVPERLRQLVYLDASVPKDGENDYYDLAWVSEEAYNAAIAGDVAGGIEAGVPGFIPVYPGVVEWLQGAITDPAEAEWFIPKLTPHPHLTRTQPVKLGNPAAAALPRAFILCTADKDMQADPPHWAVVAAEEARSDPNWRVIEMDENHVVNLNNPQGTADALLSLL